MGEPIELGRLDRLPGRATKALPGADRDLTSAKVIP